VEVVWMEVFIVRVDLTYYRFPKKEAAKIAVDTVSDFLATTTYHGS
jgi:hypothetical protein